MNIVPLHRPLNAGMLASRFIHRGGLHGHGGQGGARKRQASEGRRGGDAQLLRLGWASGEHLLDGALAGKPGKPGRLPMRCMLVGGVAVIVAAVQTAAEYAELAGIARSMTASQVLAVASAPGSCSDSELAAIGRACGYGCDEVVVFEAEAGARQMGQTTDCIVDGVLDGMGTASGVYSVPHVAQALRFGMARCEPGDVLVFAWSGGADVQAQALKVLDLLGC